MFTAADNTPASTNHRHKVFVHSLQKAMLSSTELAVCVCSLCAHVLIESPKCIQARVFISSAAIILKLCLHIVKW